MNNFYDGVTVNICNALTNQSITDDPIINKDLNKGFDLCVDNMTEIKNKEIFEETFSVKEQKRKTDFNKECYPFNAKKEYGTAYNGPDWIIFTDLSSDLLELKYGLILQKYKPYCIEAFKYAVAFHDFFKSEERHKKRLSAHKVMLFEEGITDHAFSELWIEEPYKQIIRKDDEQKMRDVFFLCWGQLSNEQRRRIYNYKIANKSVERIAKEESVSEKAIYCSIERGIATLVKKLNKSGCFEINISGMKGKKV